MQSPRQDLKRRRTQYLSAVDDVRIDDTGPLVPPACVMEDIPITEAVAQRVRETRSQIDSILMGMDDRLLVIVGPCSVHDTKSCKEYALKLRNVIEELKSDLLIVMRVYFEKPRTTVGWKGLINDPNLDGTFEINKGIRTARQFLLDVNELGIPAGCEFLDTISPQFYADLVSWGAIGARTTESQVHRELASGLSCPVGFKNGTSGDCQVAVDACKSARSPHSFLSVSKQGLAAIVHTKGNQSVHLILRGGADGPNYKKEDVEKSVEQMKKNDLVAKVMIDCSHGNSQKIHTNQPIVAADIASQIAEGSDHIFGVMIESHVNEGNQKLTPGVTPTSTLKYGVSITDACIDFDTTADVLRNLAKSVATRRASANAE